MQVENEALGHPHRLPLELVSQELTGIRGSSPTGKGAGNGPYNRLSAD